MPRSTDPAKRGRQSQNLLRGVSSDPAVRAAQVSHLTRRHEHGVWGSKGLELARERHEQELAVDYPGLDARRRSLLSDRLARIELASAWIDTHGIGPTSKARLGEAWALVDRLEAWSRTAETLLRDAEAEQVAHNADRRGLSLEAVMAELDGAA